MCIRDRYLLAVDIPMHMRHLIDVCFTEHVFFSKCNSSCRGHCWGHPRRFAISTRLAIAQHMISAGTPSGSTAAVAEACPAVVCFIYFWWHSNLLQLCRQRRLGLRQRLCQLLFQIHLAVLRRQLRRLRGSIIRSTVSRAIVCADRYTYMDMENDI